MGSGDGLIAKTAEWVRTRCQAEGSHDWFHVERVWKLARRLLELETREGAVPIAGSAAAPLPDRLVVELAALLHDIADAKYHGGDENEGPRLAREWLEGLAGSGAAAGATADAPCGPAQINQIVRIIATMSFRHGLDGFEPDPANRNFAIVRDADRLDAMGAIGIARAFAYGGSRGRALHDPEARPEQFGSREAYLASGGSSLNHFYEKLLLLKDGMLTASGRILAEERHSYMEKFVERFLKEWEGEA